ncbi:peptide ABC transporter substrate-binding protein [Tepiditoga spiralis]|uniref:Peptide ABC transporter substrate-binding protein n=1 Tax=Tepiditoga spiralis TaxID=2108365 RepID=A0A7G1G5Y3_9BACT|nr:ABC transporter substrate-binding protein [Tepiditoga spiralis]BBE31565.1 peptide ABC transporter substrate-binding protein [Tepiditoga spiralis]
MKKLLFVFIALISSILFFAEDVEWLVVDVDGGVPGNTLFLGTTSGPKTLNPATSQETSSNDIISLFLDSMLQQDQYGFVTQPALAKSWKYEKTSEGGVSYYFTLRKGLKWSDGEPLTIDDVIFTFEKIYFKNDMTPNGNDSYLDSEKNLPIIEKVDNYTVKFTYKTLVRNGNGIFGGTSILPKHIFKDHVSSSDALAQTWTVDQLKSVVASGPFILKDYKEGVRIVLEKNPNYYAKSKDGIRLPYLDKIIYTILPNNQTELLRFKAGDLDLMGITANDYPTLKAGEEEGNYKTIVGELNPGPSFIAFNFNAPEKYKRAWFRDSEFRKAVSFALDRNSVVDNMLNGMGAAVFSREVPDSKYYDEETINRMHYKYSLSKAKSILRKAGYVLKNGKLFDKFGNQVTFSIETNVSTEVWVDIANILKDSLQKLGIDVIFTPIQFNTLVQKIITTGQWDAVILRLSGDTPDPAAENVWTLKGGLHFWNFSPETKEFVDKEDYFVPDYEKRIDEIMVQQKTLLDDEKLTKLFKEFNNILAEEQVLIYTFAQNYLVAVNNKVHLYTKKPNPYIKSTYRIYAIWKEN